MIMIMLRRQLHEEMPKVHPGFSFLSIYFFVLFVCSVLFFLKPLYYHGGYPFLFKCLGDIHKIPKLHTLLLLFLMEENKNTTFK